MPQCHLLRISFDGIRDDTSYNYDTPSNLANVIHTSHTIRGISVLESHRDRVFRLLEYWPSIALKSCLNANINPLDESWA
jgi:hypothetical protein